MNRVALIASFILPVVLSADVTLRVNQAGFENSSSVVTNGMAFGFLVDTGNNGFSPGNYNVFDLTTNGQFLNVGGVASDDWFVYAGTQGIGQTPTTTSSIFGLGSGAISEQTISFTNLAVNDDFAVMWFPASTASTVGDSYGLSSDSGVDMIIPVDTGVSQSPSVTLGKVPNFTIAAVPEPSQWAAILGVLAMGLTCFRRRRS